MLWLLLILVAWAMYRGWERKINREHKPFAREAAIRHLLKRKDTRYKMKSLLVWVSAVLLGALSGYLVHIIVGYNLYLAITAGIIVGSSLGITINMQRGSEPKASLLDFEEELSEAAEPGPEEDPKIT